LRTVEEYKPKYIILLGGVSIKSLLGKNVHTTSPTSLSGRKIPYYDYDCWVFPTFHPAFIFRKNKDKNLLEYFKYTLKEMADMIHQEVALPPKLDYLSEITCSTDPNEICEWMDSLLDMKKPPVTSFDIETTGLNPYVEGHLTTCISIAQPGSTLSFPLEYPEAYESEHDVADVMDRVYEYLEREDIKKVAHRTQFENQWMSVVHDADVKGMHHCTKVGEHISDNREGITGLKHIAFVRWGIHSYDETSEKYIKSTKNSPFNRMTEMPIHEQLLYCGIDSFLTRKLYEEQVREHEEMGSTEAMRFFNEVTNMFVEMTENGLCISEKFYEEKRKELVDKLEKIDKKLKNCEEIKSFGEINFKSSIDLRKFFYEHLNCTSKKKTSGGSASVDEEALQSLNHWIADKILESRKIGKIIDYIKQYQRLHTDGVLHPLFNVYIPKSFRSSSTSPNFQNTPKRDKIAKQATRGGLKPRKGGRLVEIDFSGAEVGTSAAYHKDPNFINYLWPEEGTDAGDMHQDNAADLWSTKSGNVSKVVRFYAKNCWTFPQFYGDWYKSCADALWEHKEELLKDDISCYESLKKAGIKTKDAFIEHCKNVERIMWEERFPEYNNWRENQQLFYQENMFVDTFLGFRFQGYLDRKQTTNYNIQGTSFHLLLKVLLKMRQHIKDKKLQTKIIGQIHDSGIFDSPEHEFEGIIKKFYEYTDQLYDEYEWMEVPLSCEAEISLVDGDMAHMFEFNPGDDLQKLEEEAKYKWRTEELEEA
jgi:DNA polymerase I-like protein with 3'-5' exonuclease and polymerase domains